MRAPIVKGVDPALVPDDQDRSMRPTYYEPPFGVELRKRACTHKFGVHGQASSAGGALDPIAGNMLLEDRKPHSSITGS
jgi:hypothetical protein